MATKASRRPREQAGSDEPEARVLGDESEETMPVVGRIGADVAGELLSSGDYVVYTTVDDRGRLRTLVRHRDERNLLEVRHLPSGAGPWPDA